MDTAFGGDCGVTPLACTSFLFDSKLDGMNQAINLYIQVAAVMTLLFRYSFSA